MSIYMCFLFEAVEQIVRIYERIYSRTIEMNEMGKETKSLPLLTVTLLLFLQKFLTIPFTGHINQTRRTPAA